MAGISWRPWDAEAFACARAERRPVLLALAPAWCPGAADMDRTSYADARVAALVRDRFVPVRVDPDRRPDIGDRYGLGAWPTTVFLTPDGEVLGGGTYVEGPRLAAVLRGVSDAFAAGRHAAAPPSPPPAAPPLPVPPDRLVAHVFDSFDPLHGGFGAGPKFPHVAPVRLALRQAAHGDARAREIAVRSLDAMGWGPLHDDPHGGFFRCAQEPDWRRPHREKLLDVNAALLSLYLDAYETLGLVRYRERAADILRYTQTRLADPVEGGWAASERGDVAPGEAYPAGTAAIDRTLFSGWNAMMASAALSAGRILDDPALSEFAIRSLERIDGLCYRPGAGLARYAEPPAAPAGPAGTGPVRGLLEDQVFAAAAHLDAFEATGVLPYEMLAEELGLYVIRTMWDERCGGFRDRAAGSAAEVGLLQQPVAPFAANCAAAIVLCRLAAASGRAVFSEYAARALEGLSGRAAGHGPLAAEYVLALGMAPDR